ncbi:ribulose phosphate epimerase [Pseudenhygromyxa sp. WMMC2535]|nr:ribulose phosphate epimerase [Pseudenhygromyxa sp. WMMC2535]
MPDPDLPEDICDPFAQDCSNGEKCVPIATNDTWDTNFCVPIQGDAQAGESCTLESIQTGLDDCGAGLYCLSDTCIDLCSGSIDEPLCPESTACLASNDGTVNFCLPTCDPLVQDCAPGEGCYWANASFQCLNTSVDLETGVPCGFLNDCAPSNMCISAESLLDCEGAACCASFCDLGDDQACAGMPGLSCVAFFEEGQAPQGYEDVGICIVG